MQAMSSLAPTADSRVQARYDLLHAVAGASERALDTGHSQSRNCGAGARAVHRRCSESLIQCFWCQSWLSIATSGVVGRDEVHDGGTVVDGGVLCSRRTVVRVLLLLPPAQAV